MLLSLLHPRPRSRYGFPFICNLTLLPNTVFVLGFIVAISGKLFIYCHSLFYLYVSFQIPVHSQLWSGDWVPEPGRYRALFEATDFAKTLFETASSGRASTLAISGQDVHELAHALIAKIKAAAATNNFAPILAPERNFSM
jgi:hypothetical protein